MGLLAEAGETPFVGSAAFLASARADSTLLLLTVSIPDQALTFAREGDRYRATYGVTISLRRGQEAVRRLESREIVRVSSFKETTRTDESIVFQRIVSLAPGSYEMELAVRDDGGNKSGSIEATVNVPQLGDGSISSPVPFYEVSPRQTTDSLPHVVPTPRSTVTFGQDSVIPVYIEAYGNAGASTVSAIVHGENNAGTIWADSIGLTQRRGLLTGVINVPVSRIGVGVVTLAVARSGGRDTTKVPLFVSFGDDLPVATFGEMVSYLRYFTSASRLQTLRDSPPEKRAAEWAGFLKETDPDPSTPQHEGLRAYFGRIAQANARFREEGAAGWLTDRGRVLVSLGNPDQYFEPNMNDLNQRGHAQVWDYQRYRLRLVFIDQTGFGRYRLTVSSESEFESVLRRELGRGDKS
jgi:GWxTD domain-containing protein